jgi:hypothetical protein
MGGGLGIPYNPFAPPVRSIQPRTITPTMTAKPSVTNIKYGPLSLRAGIPTRKPKRPVMAMALKKAGQKPMWSFTVIRLNA